MEHPLTTKCSVHCFFYTLIFITHSVCPFQTPWHRRMSLLSHSKTAVCTLPQWRLTSFCKIPPNSLNLTEFTRTTFTSTPNTLNMIARKALPRYGWNKKEYFSKGVFFSCVLTLTPTHWLLISSQARNIAVYVEFRNSDEEHAKPLKVKSP